MNRTEATPAEIHAFAAALDMVICKHGWTSEELAEKVSAELGSTMTKQAVHNYRHGLREPHRATVFALERVLGMKAGTLSRNLGYLPVPRS